MCAYGTTAITLFSLVPPPADASRRTSLTVCVRAWSVASSIVVSHPATRHLLACNIVQHPVLIVLGVVAVVTVVVIVVTAVVVVVLVVMVTMSVALVGVLVVATRAPTNGMTFLVVIRGGPPVRLALSSRKAEVVVATDLTGRVKFSVVSHAFG
jgi:hypothetical protein